MTENAIQPVVTEEKNAGGRPSLYNPQRCIDVIRDAELGYSLSAYAGSIPVSRRTINEWCDAHPEFKSACEMAKVVRARFLEGGMMEKDIPSPAMNARRFALVNCAPEDWREPKQNVELTGKDGGPIKTESKVSLDGLTDAQKAALASVAVEGE